MAFPNKAFVLAAGFGTRMRPFTEKNPKPLMTIGNTPLIGYALKLLREVGIKDIVVNAHHLNKELQAGLGDGSQFGVSITYSVEEEILGTGGGLRRMMDYFDDTFIVLNSDTLVDVDLKAAYETHQKHGALSTMVLRHDPRQEHFGQIEIDASGQIRRILGTGESQDDLTPYMFCGVHVMEPRFLEYLPPDVESCVNRYGYTKALGNDEVLAGYVMDGRFADAGTPERYYLATVDALDGRLDMPHARPSDGLHISHALPADIRLGEQITLGRDVVLRGPLFLGDRIKVGDGAELGPYVCVGENSQIGRGAHVKNSVLMEGTRIEAEQSLSRVLIGPSGEISLDDEGELKDSAV